MRNLKVLLSVSLFLIPCIYSLAANPYKPDKKTAPLHKNGMKLVWAEEFNYTGKPNAATWNYERGFVRNQEFQWYQENNAFCEKGVLVIEGQKERVKNPAYDSQSDQWKKNREYAEYTSASINTSAKKVFKYGRFEIRARIDTSMGLWPAIWTLGIEHEWPSGGEIDIMESYPIKGVHHILANVASGTNRRFVGKWNTKTFPLTHFLKKDKKWPAKFHVWRMDWDENFIRLYLDDELLNETDLKNTVNPDGFEPFQQPHYLLLNLAIGGQSGGDPSNTIFPTRYEVDYVRVYQK